MSEEYSHPHVLLPFLCRFVQADSPYTEVQARLVVDGGLHFGLTDAHSERLEVVWVEEPQGDGPETTRGDLVVRGVSPLPRCTKGPMGAPLLAAARHVARRMERLGRGNPPHLLLFRNRNPQSLQWDARLFGSLCPDMLVAKRTRYFDYRVTEIDEYEGCLNVTFATRRVRVVLRLQLGGDPADNLLRQWGPIALRIWRDERSDEQRALPEHQVEEFLGYVLSRNIPPRFSLTFAHDDPPAGYLPPDHNVDFLRRTRLDDSAFFEMLLAADDTVAVVSSCDRECFNFFSLVGGLRERWTTAAPWFLPPTSQLLDHVRWLDLTTREAVMGDNPVEEVLARVGAQQPTPRLVLSVDSCLAKLVGNDVVGPVERFAASSDIPIVHYDIRLSQSPPLGPLIDFWHDLIHALPPAESPATERSVAFLGLHPDALPEASRLLEQVGVQSLGGLFPQLSLDTVTHLRSCPTVVMNAWSFVADMFSRVLGSLERPVTRLPLPYGVHGTIDWLQQVARAAGGEPDRIPDLPEVVATREQLHQERRQLAGQSVGLFARASDVREQLSPERRFGVDLLGLFRELGLAIDLNLFVAAQEPLPGADLHRALGMDPERGDRIRVFHDFRELPEIMRRGPYSVVYTETYRDERISTYGKTPLGLSALEPGLDGALRTARRLRSLMASRFYQRYHRFYDSPYEHYLHPPLEDGHGD